MGVARVDATCAELHDLLGLVVVEDVDKLIIDEMSCLQEHRHTIREQGYASEGLLEYVGEGDEEQ